MNNLEKEVQIGLHKLKVLAETKLLNGKLDKVLELATPTIKKKRGGAADNINKKLIGTRGKN